MAFLKILLCSYSSCKESSDIEIALEILLIVDELTLWILKTSLIADFLPSVENVTILATYSLPYFCCM